MKVFITVLLLVYKGHVKYNRLVYFKNRTLPSHKSIV